MILTDTHTHLYSEAFDGDRDEMIKRAMDQGIQRFFVPAIDSTYTKAMLDLQRTYPQNVFLMTGLHPTHVKQNYREELAHVEEMLRDHTFYAIGEIGMDLFWDRTFIKEQRQAFRQQIRLAKKTGLPIVIHCREAFDEVFEVLETEGSVGLSGIFHCFTGTYGQAQRAISLNMKLGIGGVVTYKNGKIDSFLGQIDLGHIVLETDSPYLAPVPYRGKRNESGYLIYILEKLSVIYRMGKEDIAMVTTQNAKEVFGI